VHPVEEPLHVPARHFGEPLDAESGDQVAVGCLTELRIVAGL